ncbi:hypothetical protein M0M57_11785 [Flavobacterium azooxidireducens]|uniref:Uncharacterized protein n=1 Tax=Flavobacterium azooxidireducens TaxID=1871076 RepID=A0ABY4KCN8_9FLAO|nr:hypothetical protein [Flavobacterium azooxidireducens]UPQ78299.1 hypothetical protein M0M57_11785 [Flavobacterium azooxidireducens]
MNTITNFWNYFQQNNFVFLLLNEIPKNELKNHFDKLIEILHQYNKDLDLIIKNKINGAELIITANGNPYLFKEVELLVHHAPAIERWKIIAFLQPETNLTKYENGTDKPLEYYGIILRISEMYFIPLENPHKPTDLGIKVLLKNYIVHKDNPRLREAIYTYIEHLIGEKAFANNIAFIALGQFQFGEIYLIKLYKLNNFLNSTNSRNLKY